MAQSADLRSKLGDMLMSERQKRMRTAAVTGIAGGKALTGASLGDIIATQSQIPKAGTAPAASDPRWALEFKRNVMGDMADFVATLKRDNASPSEAFKQANEVNKQVIDLAKSYVTANAGARGSVASAQIRGMVDLSEAYIEAVEGSLSGGSGGNSMAVFGAIRERIRQLSERGMTWGPNTMVELAGLLHDKSIPDQDKARMFAYLEEETAERFQGQTLRSILEQAAATDVNAAFSIEEYDRLQDRIQVQAKDMIRAVGSIVGNGALEISQTTAGVGQKEVADFIQTITPMLSGENMSQAAMIRLETAADLMGGALPDDAAESVFSDMESLSKVVDSLLNNEDDLDTSGTIKEVRQLMKEQPEYISWAEENDLDPTLNSTLQFALQSFRKDTREAEKANREKILALKYGTQDDPTKAQQGAGGGLGEEVEIGSGGDAPYSIEEMMGGTPQAVARAKAEPKGKSTGLATSESPGDHPFSVSDAERAEGNALMEELGVPEGVEPESLEYLQTPHLALFTDMDGQAQVGIWNPETRRFDTGTEETALLEENLVKIYNLDQEKFREVSQNLVNTFQKVRVTAERWREVQSFDTATPDAGPVLSKAKADEDVAVAKNRRENPLLPGKDVEVAVPNEEVGKKVHEAGIAQGREVERQSILDVLRKRRKRRDGEQDDPSGAAGTRR